MRSGLKQYMKYKPTKRGYKIFVMADSVSGDTCDFLEFECKSMPSKNGLR